MNVYDYINGCGRFVRVILSVGCWHVASLCVVYVSVECACIYYLKKVYWRYMHAFCDMRMSCICV